MPASHREGSLFFLEQLQSSGVARFVDDTVLAI